MNIDEARAILESLFCVQNDGRYPVMTATAEDAIRTYMQAYDQAVNVMTAQQARIEKLEKHVVLTEAAYHNAHDCEDSLCKEVERLEAESERLREALKFYASMDSWFEDTRGYSHADLEPWKTAQEALTESSRPSTGGGEGM